jgi:hypothetical protein
MCARPRNGGGRHRKGMEDSTHPMRLALSLHLNVSPPVSSPSPTWRRIHGRGAPQAFASAPPTRHSSLLSPHTRCDGNL